MKEGYNETTGEVSKDDIAQSLIVHADQYHELQAVSQRAQDHYFLLEQSNSPDDPMVSEAKQSWDDAHNALLEKGKIIGEMISMLDEETMGRYHQDFVNHGVVQE